MPDEAPQPRDPARIVRYEDGVIERDGRVFVCYRGGGEWGWSPADLARQLGISDSQLRFVRSERRLQEIALEQKRLRGNTYMLPRLNPWTGQPIE